MSQKEEHYIDCRSRMESAIAAYIKASEAIEFDTQSMYDDIADVIYDASEGNHRVEISEKETP